MVAKQTVLMANSLPRPQRSDGLCGTAYLCGQGKDQGPCAFCGIKHTGRVFESDTQVLVRVGRSSRVYRTEGLRTQASRFGHAFAARPVLYESTMYYVVGVDSSGGPGRAPYWLGSANQGPKKERPMSLVCLAKGERDGIGQWGGTNFLHCRTNVLLSACMCSTCRHGKDTHCGHGPFGAAAGTLACGYRKLARQAFLTTGSNFPLSARAEALWTRWAVVCWTKPR